MKAEWLVRCWFFVAFSGIVNMFYYCVCCSNDEPHGCDAECCKKLFGCCDSLWSLLYWH